MADELTGVNVANMPRIKTRPKNQRKTSKHHGIYQPPSKCHFIWRVPAVSMKAASPLGEERGTTCEISLQPRAGRCAIS